MKRDLKYNDSVKKTVISSKSNSIYKNLIRMKNSKKSGDFFVEGARYVQTSHLHSGISPKYIVCEEMSEAAGEELATCVGSDLFVFAGSLFRDISDTVHSQGVLAVYDRSGFQSPLSGGTLRMHCLVLDEVQDPGNVGAVVRTADAAGISDLFFVRGTADPYSPKATRASAGSILNVRTFSGTREEIIEFLGERGCDIVVTATDGENFKHFSPAGPVALILGNEARGVHFTFLKQAKIRLGIPMRGGAESLNVAVAAGILIYHIAGEPCCGKEDLPFSADDSRRMK